jgi:hypothetical protein
MRMTKRQRHWAGIAGMLLGAFMMRESDATPSLVRDLILFVGGYMVFRWAARLDVADVGASPLIPSARPAAPGADCPSPTRGEGGAG